MARERAFRELVGQLEIKRCETCRNQHTINILRTVIDEEVEKRIHNLLTKSDLDLLAKKTESYLSYLWQQLAIVKSHVYSVPVMWQCNPSKTESVIAV